jgi:flagellar motor switch protein FliN/FliY
MTTPATLPAQVLTAAAAAAAALPLPAAPTVGEPVPAGTDTAELFPLLPPGAGNLLLSEWEQVADPGAFGVIVGSSLTQALADSPLGALDVAAAVQPALDAAAAAVGATAGAARPLDLNAAVTEVFARPRAYLVPLTDADGWVCATLLFVVPAETGTFVPEATSVPDPAAGAIPRQAAAPATPAAAIPTRPVAPVAGMSSTAGLSLLRDVVMEVTVELGRTRMTISELLSLSPGAVVELDRAAGSPADLLVNGTLLARGEVVVVDEDFGIRITEIVGPVGADAPGATP